MDTNWIDVPMAAERLGTSEQMVRRFIREGRLYAERAGRGARSPWRVDAAQVAREAELRSVKDRLGQAGVVTGRSGSPDADDDFIAKMRSTHGDEAAAALQEILDRHALVEATELSRLQAELGPKFNEEDAIEQAAQRLAAEHRRAERIRRRAQEIIEQEDAD